VKGRVRPFQGSGLDTSARLRRVSALFDRDDGLEAPGTFLRDGFDT
jgi:hypothetical protein